MGAEARGDAQIGSAFCDSTKDALKILNEFERNLSRRPLRLLREDSMRVFLEKLAGGLQALRKSASVRNPAHLPFHSASRASKGLATTAGCVSDKTTDAASIPRLLGATGHSPTKA